MAGSFSIPNAVGIRINDAGTTDNHVGDGTVGGRNVVSGNTLYGIELSDGASSNFIVGNHIGMDAAGSSSVGNNVGVFVASGGSNEIGGLIPGKGT